MQKQAPSFGRVLTMVLFALSCFGLLLFLWLSFGGAVPLKPEGYRFKVVFPEATQLALEADVRSAGVSVGKVRKKEVDPQGRGTVATIELDRRFAPVKTTAKAILRQKTLLGETYVELTPGDPGSRKLPENKTLAASQVVPTVQLDEIFQALDPLTRQAFHIWQRDLSKSVSGNGQNFSDFLGNLPTFAASATDLTAVLDAQSAQVRGVISNTGNVFAALTQNEAALHNLITNSARVFRATASQNDNLALTFKIFPRFLDESKATLARLQTFALETDPLIRDLRPATRDLVPTLRDVRVLAPDLRKLFRDLGPLITVSKTGLPALRDILRGAKPVLGATGPFLSQLNPILEWLELNQKLVADFIYNGASGLAAKTSTATPGGVGHYLRQIAPNGAESIAIYGKTRAATNRGNAYLAPLALSNRETSQKEIFPNWDCTEATVKPPTNQPQGSPACYVAHPLPIGARRGGSQRYPHATPDAYPGP